MSQIPDFTETVLWSLRTALTKRHGSPVGDVEVGHNPESSTLTAWPGAYGPRGRADFVGCKAEGSDPSQRFYRAHDHFGSGRDDCDYPGECAAMLRLQADHKRQQQRKAETNSHPLHPFQLS